MPGCGCVTLISVSVFTWPLLFFQSLLCVSPIRTLVIGFRAQSDNPERCQLEIFNVITFAKILFPSSVTITGLGCGHVFLPPFNSLQIQYHSHCHCPVIEELKSGHSNFVFLFFLWEEVLYSRIKIPMTFFFCRKRQVHPKIHTESQLTLNIQKNLEK